MYLKSDKVRVFPFGNDRNIDPYGRVLNEQNIVRLIKSVVDVPSYVLTYNKTSKQAVFVIDGYYFECDLSDVVSEGQALYAGIKLDETTYTVLNDKTCTYTYLSGEDTDKAEFSGLVFSNSESELQNCSSVLQILDALGNVLESSMLKFNNTSIRNAYTTIDCGDSRDV